MLFASFFVGLFSTSGMAASTNVWSAATMRTAVRALHYPKPGARKVSCRGTSTYRCVITYRRHRRRVLYARWQGEGGWICAGPHLATCKTLRHGFLPTSMGATPDYVAAGYVENKYGVTPDTTGCNQTGTLTWSCGYQIPSGPITVTVSFRTVKGGWVTSAS
jgi:hypothetical protein